MKTIFIFFGRVLVMGLLMPLVAGATVIFPLYVANDGHPSPDAGNIEQFNSSGTGTSFTGTLGTWTGIAVDSAGNVYVANYQDNKIEKFSSTGTDLGGFTSASLSEPRGLAFDTSGNLYAANYGNNTIEKYSSTGTDLGQFATATSPTGLAFDSSGKLYVGSFGVNHIERYSSTGTDLGSFASTGTSTGSYGLAFDSSGNLYASYFDQNVVEKFSSTGTDLGAFASGLSEPTGIAIDSSGNLYEANFNLNTIDKYSSSGTNLGLFSNTGLSSPQFMALQSVPEPSRALLVLVGFGAFVTRRRRKSSAVRVARGRPCGDDRALKLLR